MIDLERILVQHGVLAFVAALLAIALVLSVVLVAPVLAALVVSWRLGQSAGGRGDFARAEGHLRRALFFARCLEYFQEKAVTGEASFRLAAVCVPLRKHQDALAFARRAVQCFKKQEKTRPQVGLALMQQAHVEELLGAGELAEAHFEEALAHWREQGARPHPMVSIALLSAAQRAQRSGEFRAALRLVEEALANGRALGERIHLLPGLVVRASVLGVLGRRDEAERDLRDALSLQEALVGREHEANANLLRQLSAILHEAGKTAESDQLLARAVAIEARRLNAP